jgi:glycerol-3-phosphate cytidylyltransferase|tara:strand:+ start:798 stop:1202 length:405 start_codon:yes stop_codon:yes gene_type:complete
LKTGFTCGSFDLLHAGHILMLEECKQHCDFLLVGLQTDPSLDRPSKNRPVQTIYERQIQLAAVRFVDSVVIYDTEADLRNLLLVEQPKIRFVSEEYRVKPFTANDMKIEIHYNSRRHDFSSSELRARCQEEGKR